MAHTAAGGQPWDKGEIALIRMVHGFVLGPFRLNSGPVDWRQGDLAHSVSARTTQCQLGHSSSSPASATIKVWLQSVTDNPGHRDLSPASSMFAMIWGQTGFDHALLSSDCNVPSCGD